jgi:hypothetical protein
MEYWVVLFADTLLALDRLLQKRLESAIPDLAELENRPHERLKRQEVIIRPRRRYAMATVLGGVVGFLFPCGLAVYGLDQAQQRMAPLPLPEAISLCAAFLALPVIAIFFFSHWLRGGEMILRPAGVVLRYRRDRVFCPWTVFENGAKPQQLHADLWALSVRPPASAGVVHTRYDTVVATGQSIRTRPLYFRANSQMVLRDLYVVRLGPLLDLLLHLGRSLGPDFPRASCPGCGDYLPEEMF